MSESGRDYASMSAWELVDYIIERDLADKFYVAWRKGGYLDGEWDARFGYFYVSERNFPFVPDYWIQGHGETREEAIRQAAYIVLKVTERTND